MPNKTSVEIYVQKQDVLNLLNDEGVTHLLIRGDITVNTDDTSVWGLEAFAFPGAEGLNGIGTCPRPCP